MNDDDVRRLWKATWGGRHRSFRQILGTGPDAAPRVQDVISYEELTEKGKIQVAETLIEECTHLGGAMDSGDIPWFLLNAAQDLKQGAHTPDDRRVPPIRAALQLTARTSTVPGNSAVLGDVKPGWLRDVLIGGIALAVPYLLGQIEFLLRVHSLYLLPDGRPRRQLPPSLLRRLGWRQSQSRRRVSSIGHTLIIFCFRNRLFVAKRLRAMESRGTLADRLTQLRHPVMHGRRGDASFDASFTGLLFAMLYFGTCDVPARSL